MESLARAWRDERPAFPLWIPVLIGFGVQIYFWAAAEPAWWTYPLALAGPLALRRVARARLAATALLLVAVGFAAAGLRAHLVAAPVLPGQVDAAAEGRVRAITQSDSGRPRLLLDRAHIFGLAAAETPARIRITLQRASDIDGLAPGDRVSVMAHLGPPGGPVEPGGFDFRRLAWFQSLGGIGYASSRVARIAGAGAGGPLDRAAITLARWRAALSAGLRARLPGEEGTFAAAIMVGDRYGVPEESLQALRDSNLAHLLAISGLHMGLVTALVFSVARFGLALTPAGRRWPIKRAAAMVALSAALFYLVISGASVATQRAFVMVAVALVAVMLNRPAVTLRALATAAMAILLLRPESLTHVGFQMSFAATAAIIAGFDFTRARGWSVWGGGGWRRAVVAYLAALVLTSLLAGLATAPYSAFHFNRIAAYGLPANLLAVPVMGFWVAPAAVAAALAAPFGLEGPALAAMGAGVSVILEVARYFAGLEGATRAIPAAAPVVLALITLGGLGMSLGVRVARLGGAAAAVAGLLIWAEGSARPDALILANARLVGVMGEAGRALDRRRGEGYAAEQWLRRDGDAAAQADAAARRVARDGPFGAEMTLEGEWRLISLDRGLRPRQLADACAPRAILVSAAPLPAPEGPCLAIMLDDLKHGGAHAIWLEAGAARIETAADRAGRRLWTRAAQ